MDFTITSNKGTWGVMHINGIMITKQFISQLILNGFMAQLVGRTFPLVISFLNSNEES